MADKKISQLTALSAANVASATDVLAIVDTSATETKKITAKDLIDGALNGGTANGVLYLNGSKVATSGSGFTYDGTSALISGGNLRVDRSTNTSTITLGGSPSANWEGDLIFATSNNQINWRIASNRLVSGALTFTPSTATGGSTFTTPAVTIDNASNVGIGTSSPGVRLDVIGTQNVSGAASGTATGTLVVKGAQSNASGLVLTQNNSTDTASITNYYNSPLIFGTNNTERARITSGGLLQVNADSTSTTFTSPGQIALKRSNSLPFISWHADNGTRNGYLQINDASASTLSVEANQALTFQTNATDRGRFTAGGNFFVGCQNTPSATVEGFCATGTSSGNITSSGSSTSTYNHWVFYNGNGLVGSISTSGSATAYNTSSDIRLKKNIVDSQDAGTYVDALKVRAFDWKVDDSHVKYGFVAQELAAVAPEAVKVGDDGEEITDAWGVDYSKLVPMLVKEIQSLRSRVAALEAQ